MPCLVEQILNFEKLGDLHVYTYALNNQLVHPDLLGKEQQTKEAHT